MTPKVHVYELPVPPSVNALYVTKSDGTVVKTRAYRQWCKTIAPQLPLRDAGTYDKVTQPYATIMWANIGHGQDLSNLFKATEDVVSTHLGLDDRWNNDIAMKRSLVMPDGRELPRLWCVFIVLLETDDAKGRRERTPRLRGGEGAAVLGGAGGGDNEGAGDGGGHQPQRGRAKAAGPWPRIVYARPAGSRAAGRGTGAARPRGRDDGGQ